ncbi:MAG: hypothetical protein J5879_07530, partial [Clostridia bacterium]|nr:hypothetical protein [Clostridia bacterium]
SLFAALTLGRLAELCRMRGEPGDEYDALAEALRSAVEAHGYDGEHYIRGYLDNGKPFGKTGDEVCEIDVLPQAFAAFAGLDRSRVLSSLGCVYDRLYDEKNRLVKLFDPPFDGQSGIGYITSYPPGVRENGGQYTHGAIWGAASFFAAGMAHKGYELLKAADPVRRCGDADAFLRYGREPYALCGDIYTANGLAGRGGWSWYTGAAGWYFRTVLEYLLGYREHDGGFEISPSYCSEFSRFSLTVRRHGTVFRINAENVKKQTAFDGVPAKNTFFRFDGGDHTLDIGAN